MPINKENLSAYFSEFSFKDLPTLGKERKEFAAMMAKEPSAAASAFKAMIADDSPLHGKTFAELGRIIQTMTPLQFTVFRYEFDANNFSGAIECLSQEPNAFRQEINEAYLTHQKRLLQSYENIKKIRERKGKEGKLLMLGIAVLRGDDPVSKYIGRPNVDFGVSEIDMKIYQERYGHGYGEFLLFINGNVDDSSHLGYAEAKQIGIPLTGLSPHQTELPAIPIPDAVAQRIDAYLNAQEDNPDHEGRLTVYVFSPNVQDDDYQRMNGAYRAVALAKVLRDRGLLTGKKFNDVQINILGCDIGYNEYENAAGKKVAGKIGEDFAHAIRALSGELTDEEADEIVKTLRAPDDAIIPLALARMNEKALAKATKAVEAEVDIIVKELENAKSRLDDAEGALGRANEEAEQAKNTAESAQDKDREKDANTLARDAKIKSEDLKKLEDDHKHFQRMAEVTKGLKERINDDPQSAMEMARAELATLKIKRDNGLIEANAATREARANSANKGMAVIANRLAEEVKADTREFYARRELFTLIEKVAEASSKIQDDIANKKARVFDSDDEEQTERKAAQHIAKRSVQKLATLVADFPDGFNLQVRVPNRVFVVQEITASKVWQMMRGQKELMLHTAMTEEQQASYKSTYHASIDGEILKLDGRNPDIDTAIARLKAEIAAMERFGINAGEVTVLHQKNGFKKGKKEPFRGEVVAQLRDKALFVRLQGNTGEPSLDNNKRAEVSFIPLQTFNTEGSLKGNAVVGGGGEGQRFQVDFENSKPTLHLIGEPILPVLPAAPAEAVNEPIEKILARKSGLEPQFVDILDLETSEQELIHVSDEARQEYAGTYGVLTLRVAYVEGDRLYLQQHFPPTAPETRFIAVDRRLYPKIFENAHINYLFDGKVLSTTEERKLLIEKNPLYQMQLVPSWRIRFYKEILDQANAALPEKKQSRWNALGEAISSAQQALTEWKNYLLSLIDVTSNSELAATKKLLEQSLHELQVYGNRLKAPMSDEALWEIAKYMRQIRKTYNQNKLMYDIRGSAIFRQSVLKQRQEYVISKELDDRITQFEQRRSTDEDLRELQVAARREGMSIRRYILLIANRGAISAADEGVGIGHRPTDEQFWNTFPGPTDVRGAIRKFGPLLGKFQWREDGHESTYSLVLNVGSTGIIYNTHPPIPPDEALDHTFGILEKPAFIKPDDVAEGSVAIDPEMRIVSPGSGIIFSKQELAELRAGKKLFFIVDKRGKLRIGSNAVKMNGGEAGHISGEIGYDGKFFISNRSPEYSSHPSRDNPKHLKNVLTMFFIREKVNFESRWYPIKGNEFEETPRIPFAPLKIVDPNALADDDLIEPPRFIHEDEESIKASDNALEKRISSMDVREAFNAMRENRLFKNGEKRFVHCLEANPAYLSAREFLNFIEVAEHGRSQLEDVDGTASLTFSTSKRQSLIALADRVLANTAVEYLEHIHPQTFGDGVSGLDAVRLWSQLFPTFERISVPASDLRAVAVAMARRFSAISTFDLKEMGAKDLVVLAKAFSNHASHLLCRNALGKIAELLSSVSIDTHGLHLQDFTDLESHLKALQQEGTEKQEALANLAIENLRDKAAMRNIPDHIEALKATDEVDRPAKIDQILTQTKGAGIALLIKSALEQNLITSEVALAWKAQLAQNRYWSYLIDEKYPQEIEKAFSRARELISLPPRPDISPSNAAAYAAVIINSLPAPHSDSNVYEARRTESSSEWNRTATNIVSEVHRPYVKALRRYFHLRKINISTTSSFSRIEEAAIAGLPELHNEIVQKTRYDMTPAYLKELGQGHEINKKPKPNPALIKIEEILRKDDSVNARVRIGQIVKDLTTEERYELAVALMDNGPWNRLIRSTSDNETATVDEIISNEQKLRSLLEKKYEGDTADATAFLNKYAEVFHRYGKTKADDYWSSHKARLPKKYNKIYDGLLVIGRYLITQPAGTLLANCEEGRKLALAAKDKRILDLQTKNSRRHLDAFAAMSSIVITLGESSEEETKTTLREMVKPVIVGKELNDDGWLLLKVMATNPRWEAFLSKDEEARNAILKLRKKEDFVKTKFGFSSSEAAGHWKAFLQSRTPKRAADQKLADLRWAERLHSIKQNNSMDATRLEFIASYLIGIKKNNGLYNFPSSLSDAAKIVTEAIQQLVVSEVMQLTERYLLTHVIDRNKAREHLIAEVAEVIAGDGRPEEHMDILRSALTSDSTTQIESIALALSQREDWKDYLNKKLPRNAQTIIEFLTANIAALQKDFGFDAEVSKNIVEELQRFIVPSGPKINGSEWAITFGSLAVDSRLIAIATYYRLNSTESLDDLKDGLQATLAHTEIKLQASLAINTIEYLTQFNDTQPVIVSAVPNLNDAKAIAAGENAQADSPVETRQEDNSALSDEINHIARRLIALQNKGRAGDMTALLLKKTKGKSKEEEKAFFASLTASMLNVPGWQEQVIKICSLEEQTNELNNNVERMDIPFTFGKKAAKKYFTDLKSFIESGAQINSQAWQSKFGSLDGDNLSRMIFIAQNVALDRSLLSSANDLDGLRLRVANAMRANLQSFPAHVNNQYLSLLLRPALIVALTDGAKKREQSTVNLILRTELAEKPRSEILHVADRLGKDSDWEFFLNRTNEISQARDQYRATVFILGNGFSSKFTGRNKKHWYETLNKFLHEFRDENTRANALTNWNNQFNSKNGPQSQADRDCILAIQYLYREMPDKSFPGSLEEALNETLIFYKKNLEAPVAENTVEYIDLILRPEKMQQEKAEVEATLRTLNTEGAKLLDTFNRIQRGMDGQSDAAQLKRLSDLYFKTSYEYLQNLHRTIQHIDHCIFLNRDIGAHKSINGQPLDEALLQQTKAEHKRLLERRRQLANSYAGMHIKVDVQMNNLTKYLVCDEAISNWRTLKESTKSFPALLISQQLTLTQSFSEDASHFDFFDSASVGLLSLGVHKPSKALIAASLPTSPMESEDEHIEEQPRIHTQEAGHNCLWVSFLNGLDTETDTLLRQKSVDLSEEAWQSFLVGETKRALSLVRPDWEEKGVSITDLETAVNELSISTTNSQKYLASKVTKAIDWMKSQTPSPDVMTPIHFKEFESVVKNGAELEDLFTRLDQLNTTYNLNFAYALLGNLEVGNDILQDQFIDADRHPNIAMILMAVDKEEFIALEASQKAPGKEVLQSVRTTMGHFKTQRWLDNVGYEIDGLGKGSQEPVIVAERYSGKVLQSCLVRMPGKHDQSLETDPLIRYFNLPTVIKQSIPRIIKALNGEVSFIEVLDALKAQYVPSGKKTSEMPDSVLEGKLLDGQLLASALNGLSPNTPIAEVDTRQFDFEPSGASSVSGTMVKQSLQDLTRHADSIQKQGKKCMLVMPIRPYCAEINNGVVHFDEDVYGVGRVRKGIPLKAFINESIASLEARRLATQGHEKLLSDIPQLNGISLVQLNLSELKRKAEMPSQQKESAPAISIDTQLFRDLFRTVTGIELHKKVLSDLLRDHSAAGAFTERIWNEAFHQCRDISVTSEASCTVRTVPLPIAQTSTDPGRNGKLVQSRELQELQRDIRSGKFSSVVLTLPAPHGAIIIEKGSDNEVIAHTQKFGSLSLKDFVNKLIDEQQSRHRGRSGPDITGQVLEIKGVNKVFENHALAARTAGAPKIGRSSFS